MKPYSIHTLSSFFLTAGSIFFTGTPIFSSKTKEGALLFDEWYSCSEKATPLYSALVTLQNTMDTVSGDAEQQAVFEKEYSHIFVVPHKEILLWESAWLSRDNTLYTDTMYAVREFYVRSGCVFIHAGNECDDHIAVEVAFLGKVLFDAQEKPELLFVAQQFMEQHMQQWCILCLEALTQQTSNPLWKSWFATTALAIAHTQAQLNNFISQKGINYD